MIRSTEDLISSFAENCTTIYSGIAITDLETDQQLSYEELFYIVDELSAVFSKHIPERSVVALLDMEGADLLSCLLALWKTDRIATLINTETIALDLDFYLDLSGGGLAITTLDKGSQLGWELKAVINTASFSKRDIGIFLTNAKAKKKDWLKRDFSSPPALITFTSGTTSKPKGVVLTQSNIYSAAESMREAVSAAPREKVILTLSLSHMYGLSVAFTYLVAGGNICILSANDEFDPLSLIKAAREYAVSSLPLQPWHFSKLLDFKEDLSTLNKILRYAASASANLDPKLLIELATALPDVDFYVYYALSEVPRAAYIKNPHLLSNEKRSTIGHAAPLMDLLIEKEGVTVDGTVFGEIILRGDMVAAGYLRADSEGFDPIPNQTFHTGDLGYLDSEGRTYWHGRKSDLIILSGNTINPWHYEKKMKEHRNVTEAVVARLTTPIDHIAILITSDSSDDTNIQQITDIADVLRKSIPGESRIYFVESLPRNANGKIIRNTEAIVRSIPGQL